MQSTALWSQAVGTSSSKGEYIRIAECNRMCFAGEDPKISIGYKIKVKRKILVAVWEETNWISGEERIVEAGEGTVDFVIKNKAFKEGKNYFWKVHFRPVNGNWQTALEWLQSNTVKSVKKEDKHIRNTVRFAEKNNVIDIDKSLSIPVITKTNKNAHVSVTIKDMDSNTIIGMGDTQVSTKDKERDIPIIFLNVPNLKKSYLMTTELQDPDNNYEILSSSVQQVKFKNNENIKTIIGWELVRNFSFENKTIKPWKIKGKGKATVAIYGKAPRGRKVAFIPKNTGLSQVIKVKPNTEYFLTAYSRVETVGKEAILGVKEYGDIEKYVTVNNRSFEKYKIKFKTGSNSHTAKVFLWTPQVSSGAYLDNVNIIEAAYHQDTDKILGRSIFEKYDSKTGLSQNDVLDIHQDKFGFMWFGTHDGLNRFDGYEFKVYKPEPHDPHSIGSNLVYGITEDLQGNIWVRTIEGGLNRMDRATEKFCRFFHDPNNPKSILDDFFFKIFVDKRNNLWVSTKKGLSYMHLTGTAQDTIQNFTHIQLPKNDKATAFFSKDNGHIIVGSRKGFLYDISDLDGENFKLNTHKATFGQIINSIVESPDNKLVIGTAWNIFYQINNGRKWKFAPLKLEDRATFLHVDNRNNLWVASDASGLYRYTFTKGSLPKIVEQYAHNPNDKQSLSENSVICLEVDNKGIIWAGTKKGINKMNPNRVPFQVFNNNLNANSLSSSRAKSILKDSYGGTWVGLQNDYLNYKKPGTAKDDYNTFISIPIINVYSLEEVSLNDKRYIIIGTLGNNYMIELEDFTGWSSKDIMEKAKAIDALAAKSIFDIEQDKYGQVWIASYNGGLIKWSVDENNSLNQNPDIYLVNDDGDVEAYTRCLYFDDEGNLWAGTSKGVRKIKAKDVLNKKPHIEYYKNEENDPNSISLNYVVAITGGKEGDIWVGTLGGGINQMIFNQDGKISKVNRITENSHGLSNNVVRLATRDQKNNIWIATNQGISKINPKTLNIKNYDIDDGLQDNEFLDLSCYYDMANNRIYMGGTSGVNYFCPDSIKNQTLKPSIVFTDLFIKNTLVKAGEKLNGRVILDKAISETKDLEITYKENNFTIKFAALHYGSPIKNQYKYKLEGFDKDWIPVSSSVRSATYTNLEEGEYTFKVIASNNDNIWNEKGITLSITVTPPWWETIWFKALVFLSLTSMAYIYYKRRTYVLKQRQIELENLVEQRTGELKSANEDLQIKHEEVQSQAEELQTQRDNLAEKNEVIIQKSQLIETLSEIGQEITSSIDIHNIVSSMYQNLNRITPIKHFEIGMVDEVASKVFYHGFHGTDELQVTASDLLVLEQKNMSCTQWVTVHRKPLIINNLSMELDNYADELDVEKYYHKSYQSMIYYPLTIGEKLVGIMVLKDTDKNAFDEETISILESIVDYATISIDNAKTYTLLQGKTEHITSSIRYAQTIQEAILPFGESFQRQFKDFFVLFRPKDIVSGDFYWMAEQDDRVYLAAIDCTGHGVPGAFMSMIGSSILNKIVKEQGEQETDKILDLLDVGIRKALKQEQSKNDDGMDLVMCCFHKNTEGHINKVSFTGAKNPLFYYKKDEDKIIEIRGDRKAIGGVRRRNKEFTCQELDVKSGDAFYLLTDGIIDQHRKDRSRFGKTKLLQLLNDNATLNLEEQYRNISNELDNFQGEEKQRDDITVIGVKI